MPFRGKAWKPYHLVLQGALQLELGWRGACLLTVELCADTVFTVLELNNARYFPVTRELRLFYHWRQQKKGWGWGIPPALDYSLPNLQTQWLLGNVSQGLNIPLDQLEWCKHVFKRVRGLWNSLYYACCGLVPAPFSPLMAQCLKFSKSGKGSGTPISKGELGWMVNSRLSTKTSILEDSSHLPPSTQGACFFPCRDVRAAAWIEGEVWCVSIPSSWFQTNPSCLEWS